VLVPLALAALGFAPASGLLAACGLVVLGAGMGLQMPTTLITVQQSVPRDQIGTVTALTAFFRLLGGAIGIAVLSSVVLLLLREHLPAGIESLDAEGLGQLIDASRAGHGAPASDVAFQRVMWLSAGISVLSLWFAARLPDLRLHDAGQAAPEAAV
jgi:MFS family permease